VSNGGDTERIYSRLKKHNIVRPQHSKARV